MLWASLVLAGLSGLSSLGAPAHPVQAGDMPATDSLDLGLRAAIEREWTVRRRAQAPSHAEQELLAALASAAWLDRAQALVACERALAAGLDLSPALVAACAGRLEDPHPSVRAGAATCCALLGSEFVLGVERARRLAADPLPQVRIALARALGRVRCTDAGALLLVLTRDPDERVAHSACLSLATLPSGPAASAPKLEYLAGLIRAGNARGLWQLAGWLERGTPDAVFLEAAPAHILQEDSKALGWSAIFVALAIGHTGRGAVERDDVEQWMAGWDDPIGRSPEGRRLLRFAARSGRTDLARVWLTDLDRASDESVEELLAGALITCLGAQGVLELMLEVEPSSATWQLMLPAIGAELETWRAFEQRPDAGRWWEPGVARAARLAAVDALESTLSRRGDDAAARLLMAAIDDDDEQVARRVLRALSFALGTFEGELHTQLAVLLAVKWRSLDVIGRRELAAYLPAAQPLEAFRELWMAWGADPEERALASEFLRAYTGDAGVAACLEAWLTEDLESCSAVDSPPRALELRVLGELRSFGRVAGKEAITALELALESFDGRSAEIAKVAAHELGRTPEGRRVLEGWLGPTVTRRTRIEAAIALLNHASELSDARAAFVLVRDHEHAASNLSVRILAACGRGTDRRSLELLERTAASSESPFEVRLAAIDALAVRAEVRALRELAIHDLDVEMRRAALHALGTLASAEARSVLVRLFAEIEAAGESTSSGEEDWAVGERMFLRAELLGALGRARLPLAADEREHLERAWLRDPIAHAAAGLAANFQGAASASVDFNWSGELALGRELGAEGRIARALERNQGWWRVDGELLLALAQLPRVGRPASDARDPAAAAEADVARDLTRAAVIALHDDAEPSARRGLGSARCLLLGHAWRSRRWAAYRRLAEELLLARTSGTLPRGLWSRAFGVHSRPDGVDPGAELRTSIQLAAGWEALGSGARPGDREARERASDFLARARELAGFSRRALARCEGLARSIEQAGDRTGTGAQKR